MRRTPYLFASGYNLRATSRLQPQEPAAHDGSSRLGRRLRPRTRLPLGGDPRRYSRGDPGGHGRPRGQSRHAGARGGPRDPCRHGRALAHARAAHPGRRLAAARRRRAAGRSAAGLSRLPSHGRRLADADHRHAVAVHRTPRALLGLGRAASQHAVAAKLGHRRPGRPEAAGRVVGRTGGRHDAHQSARSARPRRAPGGQSRTIPPRGDFAIRSIFASKMSPGPSGWGRNSLNWPPRPAG